MINISIEKINSDLGELKLDGIFVKYIKIKELPALSKDLNEWLKQHDDQFSSDMLLTPGSSYQFSFDSKNEELDFIEQLKIGKDKKEIALPPNLQTSLSQLPVIYAHRSLDNFQKYWKSGSKDQRFSLYEQLSQDLIEVPYVDEPDDFLSLKEELAFHTNHGTTHGIRQTELAKAYFELIKSEGNETYKSVALSVSPEELACLELAAFLFRVGRTNERGWEGDPTYGPRSAAIFKHIALELKLDRNLVDLMSSCFDYHAKKQITNSLPSHTLNDTINKVNLFTKLLKLSHESDLVRCFENYNEVKRPIIDELEKLVNPEVNLEQTGDNFLSYAAALCRETGAMVTAAKNSSEKCFTNKKIAIDSAKAPKQMFYKLIGIKPAGQIEFEAPTKIWIKSEEHAQYINKEKFIIKAHDEHGAHTEVQSGWTEEEMSAIPTKQCIQIEKQYIRSHVSVYHATTKASYAMDLLCRQLKMLSEGSNQTAWVRDFHSKPKIAYNDISEIKEEMSHSLSLDNKENNAWHLLSCNPSLWQNSDYDSQESTVDYFYTNTSVINLDFEKLIYKLLDEIGLLVDQDFKRKTFFKKFIDIINNNEYGSQGVIYQYVIPHHLVDEVAYISKGNGKLDDQNLSTLDTLLSMKTPGAEVPNQNTLQVRLFVPKLLTPYYANQIIVNNYLNLDQALIKQFENEINLLAKEAFNGPTNGIKVQPEKAKDPSYTFNLLEGLKLRKQMDFSQFVKPQKTKEINIDLDEMLLFSDTTIMALSDEEEENSDLTLS